MVATMVATMIATASRGESRATRKRQHTRARKAPVRNFGMTLQTCGLSPAHAIALAENLGAQLLASHVRLLQPPVACADCGLR